MPITIPFSPKGSTCAADMLAVTVASKATKDDAGKTIPAPFAPFVVILPSNYLAGVSALPEVFRPSVLEAIADQVKKVASARKLAGMESVILEDTAEAQLRKANESVSLTITNISTFFEETLLPLFETVNDVDRRTKAAAKYLAVFKKLANGAAGVTVEQAEKLLALLAKAGDSSPIAERLLAKLEKTIADADSAAELDDLS